jgi:integrin alpha FG-GAP repeat containing protein 1
MNSQQACKLANPHSSAFVDIDGDCVPGQLSVPEREVWCADGADLVLHCEGDSASMSRIQIWLNRGSEGYELSRTYELPRGSGPLTFADMSASHS